MVYLFLPLSIAILFQAPRNAEYEYIEDLTVQYSMYYGRFLYSVNLNSVGQPVADPNFMPRIDKGATTAGHLKLLMHSKPGEKLYEYHAGRLVPGVIKPDRVIKDGPGPTGSPGESEKDTSYFFPDLDGKVIEFSEYLKTYDPIKSRRIYNLPGTIVKKVPPK